MARRKNPDGKCLRGSIFRLLVAAEAGWAASVVVEF